MSPIFRSAKGLGLDVVAESVETGEPDDHFKDMDRKLAQGF
jgi:EAL domain-containing protein (putative c-di-GMP-specific phosphodiesterase class I)